MLTACAAQADQNRLPIGEALYRLVVGGPEVGAGTLLRFYAWHVIGLAAPLILLILWHGFRVRRDGGISSPPRLPDARAAPRTDRAVSIRSEVLAMLLTVAALIVISALVEPPLGPPALIGAQTEHTLAPWIFLWVQELLRVWPPALAGVVTPLAVILLLSLLPYMDWSNEGIAIWFNRQGRIAQIVVVALFVAILGLTIRAALR
jgi:quinol-cytochrome oxidoreductase complex cytochrome b subunit